MRDRSTSRERASAGGSRSTSLERNFPVGYDGNDSSTDRSQRSASTERSYGSERAYTRPHSSSTERRYPSTEREERGAQPTAAAAVLVPTGPSRLKVQLETRLVGLQPSRVGQVWAQAKQYTRWHRKFRARARW